MTLPLSDRVLLAQVLWESIDAGGVAEAEERAAVAQAMRRDKELSSGLVTGRKHEGVIQSSAARLGFTFPSQLRYKY